MAMQAFLEQGDDSFFSHEATVEPNPSPTVPAIAPLLNVFGEDVEDDATSNQDEQQTNTQSNQVDPSTNAADDNTETQVHTSHEKEPLADLVQTQPPQVVNTPTSEFPQIDWSQKAKQRRKVRLAHYKEVYHNYCNQKRELDPMAKTPKLTQFIEQLNAARQAFIEKNDCADVRFVVYMKKGRVAVKAKPHIPKD